MPPARVVFLLSSPSRILDFVVRQLTIPMLVTNQTVKKICLEELISANLMFVCCLFLNLKNDWSKFLSKLVAIAILEDEFASAKSADIFGTTGRF